MPTEEQDAIQNSTEQIEFRQVRIGEKVMSNGKEMPNRLNAPVIVYPVKTKIDREVHEKSSKDDELMGAIRAKLGLAKDAELRAVPIRFMSDNKDEIVSVYRGMFRQNHKSLCFSILGDPKATRWFDTREKLNNGKLVILKEPESVDCNKKCHWWEENGEKGVCSWHSRVTFQLEQRPWIVAASRYRSSGWTVIKHMRASLNRLAAITDGVLANIPFVLVEYQKDSVSKKENKTRTHPVVVFDFLGTLDELREAAIRELESRRRLRMAKEGRDVSAPMTSVGKAEDLVGQMVSPAAPLVGTDVQGETGDLDGFAGGDDDFVSFDDDAGVAPPQVATVRPATVAEVQTADAMEKEIADLVTKLSFTDRALEALFDKHACDAASVLEDLRTQAGDRAKPVNAPPPPPAVADAAGVGDIGDLDWGPGEASDEPSENDLPKPGTVTAENGTTVSPAVAPPGAPAPQPSADLTEEFDQFQVFDP